VCEKLPTVEQMASGVGQLTPHGVVPLPLKTLSQRRNPHSTKTAADDPWVKVIVHRLLALPESECYG
jgi:hypothetical protein